MSSRIIYLTRHGETRESLGNIIQGQSDTLLTINGELQAKQLGLYLAQKCAIRSIISSDLSRAMRSGQLIAEQIGASIKILIEPALREIACGNLEGKLYSELSNFRKNHVMGIEYAKPEGGESIEELRRRVLDWYYSFVSKVQHETLIVTHRGPISIILRSIEADINGKLLKTALSYCPLISINLDDSNNSRVMEYRKIMP